MDFCLRTPFFRLTLPVIFGILIAVNFALPVFFAYLLCVVAVTCFVCFAFFKSTQDIFKYQWVFGTGLFLFLFALALILTQRADSSKFSLDLNSKGIYQVEVLSSASPKAKTFKYLVLVRARFDGQHWIPMSGKSVLFLSKKTDTPPWVYGDKIMVRTEFVLPNGAVNPGGFDYATYLKRQGVLATCFVEDHNWNALSHSSRFSLVQSADRIRNCLLKKFKECGISGDEYAVLSALTLGYTDEIQPDIRESYSATGAMHILSVSGMHVGIVYVVMIYLLTFMDKTPKMRLIKAILLLSFLWAYAYITGLSAAVVRAATMFSFVALASLFNRKSSIYNTVFISLFLMLLVNPYYLFDVGFQLSYAAVLSILFFQPYFKKLYQPRHKVLASLWGLCSVSVAAQLGTAPITLYYFKQFPNYFLLTNLLVIPLSTVIIYLAMFLLVVSYFDIFGLWVGKILEFLLFLLNKSISSIEHFSFSVTVIPINLVQSITLFVVLLSISFFYVHRKKYALFVALFCFLLVSFLALRASLHTLKSDRIIVYYSYKNTHVNFIHRFQNYLYSSNLGDAYKVAGLYWKCERLLSPKLLRNCSWYYNGFVFFHGLRVVIPDRHSLLFRTSSVPIDVDYLILGNNLRPKIKHLFENFRPKKVIIDGTISKNVRRKLKSECLIRSIPCYSVADQGAFYIELPASEALVPSLL